MIRQKKLKIAVVKNLRRSSFASLAVVFILCSGCSVEEQIDSSEQASLVSQAQTVLVEHCGSCHVAPKPNTKFAKDWRAVVLRMQAHRSQRAMPVLSEMEINDVTEYLEKRSKEQ